MKSHKNKSKDALNEVLPKGWVESHKGSISEEINKLQRNEVINTTKKNESGFFPLDILGDCNSEEHDPPKMLHIPPGKGYRHVCPQCGKITTIIPQQTTL